MVSQGFNDGGNDGGNDEDGGNDKDKDKDGKDDHNPDPDAVPMLLLPTDSSFLQQLFSLLDSLKLNLTELVSKLICMKYPAHAAHRLKLFAKVFFLDFLKPNLTKLVSKLICIHQLRFLFNDSLAGFKRQEQTLQLLSFGCCFLHWSAGHTVVLDPMPYSYSMQCNCSFAGFKRQEQTLHFCVWLLSSTLAQLCTQLFGNLGFVWLKSQKVAA